RGDAEVGRIPLRFRRDVLRLAVIELDDHGYLFAFPGLQRYPEVGYVDSGDLVHLNRNRDGFAAIGRADGRGSFAVRLDQASAHIRDARLARLPFGVIRYVLSHAVRIRREQSDLLAFRAGQRDEPRARVELVGQPDVDGDF